VTLAILIAREGLFVRMQMFMCSMPMFMCSMRMFMCSMRMFVRASTNVDVWRNDAVHVHVCHHESIASEEIDGMSHVYAA
jgi:hypothetical protein